MKKKRLLFVPLALSMILAGCSNDTGNSSESQSASQEQSQKESSSQGDTSSTEVSVSSKEQSSSQETISSSEGEASSSEGSSSSEEPAPIVTIVLKDASGNTSGTAYVGETLTLAATVTNGDVNQIVWTSSNDTVATVTGGTVNALQAGNTTIKAAIGEVSATYELTVNAVVAEGVTINDKDNIGVLPLRREKKLTATVSPDNTTDKTITWESDNPEVATVSAEGLVKGVSKGTATITAKNGTKSDSVSITVGDPIINAKNSGLPASYKAEVTREYQVDVTHGGYSTSDPYDFRTDSSIQVDYDGTPVTVPTMHLLESEVIDGSDRTCYVKFIVKEAGTYYLFSHGGLNAAEKEIDTGIASLLFIPEEGTSTNIRIPFPENDSRSSSDENALRYTATSDDFFTAQMLNAGTYLAQLRLYGDAGDFDFGVVNATKDGEGNYVITSATGNSAKEDKQELHQMEFVKDKALISTNGKFGYYVVEGEPHEVYYQEEEEEWLYRDEASSDVTIAEMNQVFSWESILSDPALAFTSTSTKETMTVDLFTAEATAFGENSGIGAFLYLLGVHEYATNFMVAVNVNADTVIGLGVTFADDAVALITLTEETDLSITVNHHNVNNGGEAGDDSGVSQDW